MYLLGIDNGGTTTKAAVYTTDGREIGVCSTATAAFSTQLGFVERDMEEMWKANCYVIKSVLSTYGIEKNQISCVGICGHGKGLYLWGKDNRPVRNGIISTDTRASEIAHEWKLDGTEDRAYELTYQHIMPCQPAPLLKWLKINEPFAFDNIAWIFGAKDYVRFRLTGEVYGELTDYSGSGLVNLKTKQYDSNLLTMYGLEEIEYALPKLVNSTDICGTVSMEAAKDCGLAAGTPVIAGMFDIDACTLAAGITDSENTCMIAGTWSINCYLSKTPVIDNSVQMNSLFVLPDYYLIEESSPTSAGNLEWFLNNVLTEAGCGEDKDSGLSYEEINSWVDSIPVKEFCPIFLPFVMASNTHINGQAAFVGITLSHTVKHLLRSIYEGVAFSHRYHYDRLKRSRSSSSGVIRLAGGAASSTVWAQMFADVMGTPVEIVSAKETGTLGVSVAAYSAVEQIPLREAASRMSHISKVLYPDKHNTEVYGKKYSLYLKINKDLYSAWDYIKIMEQ